MNAKRIPVSDPHASYLSYKNEIDAAIHKVLDSGWYILGEVTREFESNFADYIGVKHCVGVNSGTDAISLALRALDIGAGDEVITVSLTAVATVAAIDLVGATPVLCDIDPDTRYMDASKVQGLISEKTKAILPVHLYGHPADLPALQAIAKKHNLFLIEDCAQAHGAQIDGKMIGSFGDLACFSFYPTKNLGAFGDGGAVCTNNDALADRLRWLREYGWKERYISYYKGMNTRLDEMQAAILNVKLKHLEHDTQKRIAIAQTYQHALAGLDLKLPSTKPGYRHVYHLYVVEANHREGLQTYLRDNGIATAIHYPQAVHQQPAYSQKIKGFHDLPVTNSLVPKILSLPMYPELSEDKQEHVIEMIRRFYSN
ncbi:MAG TPA: DegT/DnrJ/EryC1/StrS family aminotransferase [Anaerolineaceae bacterium]|nr:DegT/DnrJ/EryC1/StrS family aminotransferase [Anaerolineaceae bacterium]